jgi:exopolysaccharide biosynthesis predicted pyruvyltransferase EpsI
MNDMTIRDFLGTLRGSRVFFDPLHGNHGDHLLRLAAQSMLKDADLTPVRNPQSSDFILLNGGGSMADGWFGLERLARYSKEFPSHPLAVMPSSFYPTRSSLADITRERKAPMWLWAREQPSLDILEDAGLDDKVSLGLDHDLAFSLDQHPMIRDLKNISEQGLALIVERDDWEGPTGRGRPLSPPGLEFIPEKIRAAVRKTLLGPYRKRQDRISPFKKASLQFVNQNHPEFTGLEPLVADISLAETCSFEDFLQYIARASVIITTRLHVAVVGHMLKRKTYLVAGSYHKFRGVFDYSMQRGSTRLLRWNGLELEQ